MALKPGVLDCTSQSGGEKEVSAVFPDQALRDGLQGRTPPQLADGVLEVGIEGKSQAPAACRGVPPLRRQAVDLPSTKLPGNTPRADAFVSRLGGAASPRWLAEDKPVCVRVRVHHQWMHQLSNDVARYSDRRARFPR